MTDEMKLRKRASIKWHMRIKWHMLLWHQMAYAHQMAYTTAILSGVSCFPCVPKRKLYHIILKAISGT